MHAPLQLARFGSYHVGGRQVRVAGRPLRSLQVTRETAIDHDPNGDYLIEQAYVQWFEPARRRHDLPLVLLHGGGMTGVVWETTPDGRPGWLHAFVQAGFAVHVVDGVERGRASWCALPGEWPDEPAMRSLQEAWSLFRFGPPEDFAVRRPFPGQRFPVHALESLARQFVPRWTSTGEAARRALHQVVERVGPCVLVCHSQGGEAGLHVAAERPELVRAVVGIEPSGGFDTVEGLARTPLLLLLGDHLGRSPQWIIWERRLRAFAADLAARAAPVRIDSLPACGIAGNSHLPMMDDNNLELAQRVVRWLAGAGI